MAKLFEYKYQQRVEQIYYNHGMFVSSHPILMICVSAIIILLCCYPLLNLPLPGSEPSRFLTPLPNLASVKTVGRSLPYDDGDESLEVPQWFHPSMQVAYVQQFLVKSVVNPWKEDDMIPTDAYRAPLSKLFTLLEEIENFHLEDVKESHSVTAECLHVTETVIKQGKHIKPVFPEYGCLILSPASFWKKSSQEFQNDPNILHTMSKYIGKAIETSPSIKELLFGMPSKECGVTNFIVRNRQRVITYAITVVLKSYDSRMLKGLKEKIQSLYPSKMEVSGKENGCDPKVDGENCENSSDSGGGRTVTHIHFKSQIGIHELIPLLSTYFIMGCYIYFSVRKINFVKSKLGMAFSAVVSIMASLMMSVGLCSLFGLTPTLNGGEIFPYLIIVIGLENILVITKSVVATPIHLDVDKRIALGISREGCSIMKNLLLELVLIGLGYFTFVPEIQEFCAFAVVGILSDYFMHIVFFTTVLSIDIRRLDITEDIYSQPESEDEVESPEQQRLYPELGTSLDGKSRKKSVLEHLRLTNRQKKKGSLDKFHKVESGGKSVTILKIPKRLRVLFFWADTRMVQRLLMVCMIIWIAILMYSDPFGNKRNSSVHKGPEMRIRTGPPVPPIQTKESNIPDHSRKETSSSSPNKEVDLMWSSYDLNSHQRLSFRHWPTIFAYYNITLAGRFVSILPPIPLTILVTPDEAKKARHSSETAKHESRLKDQGSLPSDLSHLDENMSQQLPPYSYTGRYPMTGLDYYLTLLLGAVAGVIMVFLLTVMYKCICTRNYANWRTQGGRRRRMGEARYTSSIGDSMPLVLAGHPQLVECLTVDGPLLVSADLSGEVRVWDIHSGDCTCVIHRIKSPVPHRDPAEGAIDAKPTPIGHQENDLIHTFPYVNPCQTHIELHDNHFNHYSRSSLADNILDATYEDNAAFEKGHSRHRSWNAPPKTHNRSRSGDGMAGMFNQQLGQASFERMSSPYSLSINLSSTIQTQFSKIANAQQIRKRNIPSGQRNDDNGLNNSNCSDIASFDRSSRGNLELGEGENGLKLPSSGEFSAEEDVSRCDKGYNFQDLLSAKFAEQQKQYPDHYSVDPKSTALRYPYGRLTNSQSQLHNNNHVNPYYPQSQPVSPSTPNSIHSPPMNKHSLINRREITGRYSLPSSANSIQQTNINPQMGAMDDNTYRMWGSWESGLGAATPLSGPASWGSMPESPLEMENGPSVWCLVCIRNFVITGCENGRIEVWDSTLAVLKCSHDVGKAGVCGLAAEETKLVAARINGSLDFFSMEATSFHPTLVQYRGTTRSRNDSGKTMDDLMSGDVLILQLIYTVKSAHQQPITAFKMAVGRVLTGSCDHTLKLFTVQDARCLYTLFGHASAITALYMDQGPPSGAASGSSDGTVRLWDLPTGECLHKFDEHKGEVTAVQCTEMHVISAAQDDKLCVWARRTGMLLHVRCLDTGCSSGMCLLGNSWCVTGGLGCVLLWDIRNGDLVRRIRLSDDSHGPSSRVNQIVPVANLCVACDVGKELRIVFFPAVLEKVD